MVSWTLFRQVAHGDGAAKTLIDSELIRYASIIINAEHSMMFSCKLAVQISSGRIESRAPRLGGAISGEPPAPSPSCRSLPPRTPGGELPSRRRYGAQKRVSAPSIINNFVLLDSTRTCTVPQNDSREAWWSRPAPNWPSSYGRSNLTLTGLFIVVAPVNAVTRSSSENSGRSSIMND